MRTELIVNPRGADRLGGMEAIERIARRRSITLHVTEAAGDAERLARDAAQRGDVRLIVTGGDGTIHEAANGLVEFDTCEGDTDADEAPVAAQAAPGVELAILPAGTANDLARSLCIDPDQPLEDMIDDAMRSPAAPADVLCVQLDDREPRVVVNAASGGFAGEVKDRLTPEHKRAWGQLAYWIAGAQQFTELRNYNARLTIDGSTQQLDLLQIGVANGRYVGGGVEIAPDARLDDGMLDVIVAQDQSRMEMLATLIALGFSRHVESENVLTERGRRVTIETDPPLAWSLDGELQDSATRATFNVAPGALMLARSETAEACRPAPGASAEQST